MKNTLNVCGLAIFNGDKYVGDLDNSSSLFHLIITNNFKNGIIDIPSPFTNNDFISLDINNVKTKNRVKIINHTPFIECDIHLSARAISSTLASNYLNSDNIELIEDCTNSLLKSQIEKYLYKTSIEYNSDISSFGKYAVHNFDTISQWNNYNWLNNYKNSFFKINVTTNIVSSYIISGITIQ